MNSAVGLWPLKFSFTNHSLGGCPWGTRALQLFDEGERSMSKIAMFVKKAFPEWQEKNPTKQVRTWLRLFRFS